MSHIVSSLEGFSSFFPKTKTYLMLGVEQWWQEKASVPQHPNEQLLKQAMWAWELVPSSHVGPQVMVLQLGDFAPFPSWGNSKGWFCAPFALFLSWGNSRDRFCSPTSQAHSQLPGFWADPSCSLAWAWLKAAAELGGGKVNFKSPSCTCVGPCSCVHTDEASSIHVSHSYGSGLWSKINNKKWVGH